MNIHPTKQEVHFLHEDAIIDSIQKEMEKKLLECDSSRTYYTQCLLPSSSGASISHLVSKETAQDEQADHMKVYDYKMVRTDSKEKKIAAFVLPKLTTEGQSGQCNPVSQPAPPPRPWKTIDLTSVLSLQKTIRKSRHDGNTTWRGCR